MNDVERHLKLARALMTGSAPRLEQDLDVVLQRDAWQQHTGRSLTGEWFAVIHPDGQTRYIYTSDDQGTSTWDRPSDVEIAVTFTMRPDRRIISRRIDRFLAANVGMAPEIHAFLTAAVRGSQPDFNSQALTTLAERNSERAWGIRWPASGVPPVEALKDWLLAARQSCEIDGNMMAALRFCLEIWDAIAHDDASPLVQAQSAKALRGHVSGPPLALLRETVLLTAAAGQLAGVIEAFNRGLAAERDAMADLPDAAGIESFYDAVYEAVPIMIGIATMGMVLTEDDVPLSETTRRKIEERRIVSDENHVRLMTSVDHYIRNLISNDLVWRHHVDLVRDARHRSEREAQRLVTRLTDQLFVYPRSVGRQLLQEAKA